MIRGIGLRDICGPKVSPREEVERADMEVDGESSLHIRSYLQQSLYTRIQARSSPSRQCRIECLQQGGITERF